MFELYLLLITFYDEVHLIIIELLVIFNLMMNNKSFFSLFID